MKHGDGSFASPIHLLAEAGADAEGRFSCFTKTFLFYKELSLSEILFVNQHNIGYKYLDGQGEINMDERKVEVSYKVIADAKEILTVAIFINQRLLHIVAGKTSVMIPKLNKLFG